MWQPWTGPGLESLRLVEDADGVRVDSVTIGVHEGAPFAIRYAIRCDAAWHVRDVEIASLEGRSTTLALSSNGMGRWTDGAGDVSAEITVDADGLVVEYPQIARQVWTG